MIELLDFLKKRTDETWLINYNSQEFYDLTLQIYETISDFSQPQRVLIFNHNSFTFLAHFLGATAAKCPIFLGNYDWQESEWEQVFNLVKPQIILSNTTIQQTDFFSSQKIYNSWDNYIMIPTGGTSGKIKFAIHSWQSLTASVTAFQKYFKLKQINFCCTLPLYHVSGLMQFLRCLLMGGKFLIWDYQSLKNHIYPEIKPQSYFISLVPTQLQFLLEQNPQWLAQFKTVLLGGAPPWQSLLNKAREYKINLAITYGMTETASGVVTLKSEDFLQGNNSTGQLLPHTKIKINENGNIYINSDSNFLGYYPNLLTNNDYFQTDDLGYFDEEEYLYIIGRNSRKIISGGENIYPEEIEALILATDLVKDVCVIGVADHKWGEVVTAIYVTKNNDISEEMIIKKIENKLTKYKLPKKWINVTEIPRNKQGKLQLNLIS